MFRVLFSTTQIQDLIRFPLLFSVICYLYGAFCAFFFVFSMHTLTGVKRGMAPIRGGGRRERDGRVEGQLLGRALRHLQRLCLLGPQVSHARGVDCLCVVDFSLAAVVTEKSKK